MKEFPFLIYSAEFEHVGNADSIELALAMVHCMGTGSTIRYAKDVNTEHNVLYIEGLEITPSDDVEPAIALVMEKIQEMSK